MKTYRAFFVTTFFSIFGFLQFLFFIRGTIPHMGGINGVSLFNTVLCLCAALVLSASHTVISLDTLDNRISIKTRLIIGGIPSMLVCGVLTVYSGLPSLIIVLLGISNRETAIIIWIIGFVICCGAFASAYFAIEWHYYKMGKKYNVALAAYKSKTTGEKL